MIISATADLNSLGNPQIYNNGNILTIASGATNVNILLEYDIINFSGSIFYNTEIGSRIFPNTDVVSYIGTKLRIRLVGNINNPELLINQYFSAYDTNENVFNFDYNVEVLQPNTLTTIQRQCTYCEDVDWNNLIMPTPPSINGRGVFEILDAACNKVLATYRGASIVDPFSTQLCYCEQGTYSIYGRYTVRAIPNCGGTSPIVFQSIGEIDSFVIKEYKPFIDVVSNVNCCYTLGESSLIDFRYTLNNWFDSVGANEEIEFTLTDPNGDVESTTTITPLTLNIDSIISFSFTPTILGKYKLSAVISNGSPCLSTSTKNVTLNVCSDWILTNTECNKFKLDNFEAKPIEYQFQKFDINTNTFISIVTPSINVLLSGQSIELDYGQDGISKVIVNDKEFYFLSICNISKCYDKVMNDILCSAELKSTQYSQVENCDTKEILRLMEKHNKFKYLHERLMNFYYKFKTYQEFSSETTKLVITDLYEPITDVLEIKDIMKELSKMCGLANPITSPCYSIVDSTITISNQKEDCGCGCK